MFVPASDPPTDPGPRTDRWYLVADGEVLLDPGGRIPESDRFLAGLALPTDTEVVYLGTDDDVGCWAAGVPTGTAPPEGGRFEGLRALGAHGQDPAWLLAGRAVQLVEWQRTSRFCGRCGTATVAVPHDRAMRCPACGLRAYPRVAPAVIVAIHRDDQLLLARNRAFPGAMFSCVAGFVEPGETLEECVRREVAEEVGVELGAIRYEASQPWPFPHSLMVGFQAAWSGGDICVDGDEIVEAHWFGADALPDLPPPVSIARRLIDIWLGSDRD